MTELETRLVKVLDALSGQLEALEKRLETMTKNYRILSQQIDGLLQRTGQTESVQQSLLEQLRTVQEQQSALVEPLEQLRRRLRASSKD